jgi:glucosylceramidase
MKVIQYSTNKYGEFVPVELRESLYMGGAVVAKVAESVKSSEFLGFGVAITGSSCYNLAKMESGDRRALLEQIYGKDGLGLSVARLTIGSSDYSAELYSYDDVEGDEALEHFSIARDEEYIIPMIKEILSVNPEVYFYASPWSPPGWMKTGGSMCGGYMRAKYIECYAEYFIKYIKAYAAHGIKIRAVTPQNEPETQQFGKMPACCWNPETEVEFVRALRKRLIESGLSEIEIWPNDHSFAYSDKVDWQLREFPEFRKDICGVAFHYYDGSIEQTEYLIDKYGVRLHFTEGGPRLYDHYDNDWCKWGIMMSKTLNSRYSSFTGWNLMLDETGGPNIGPFFCGGLVTRNRLSGELSYSGQYKAFKHFAKYVKPDSRISAIEFDKSGYGMFSFPKDQKALCGTLVENSDGIAALMLVNPNPEKAQVQYFRDGKWWYIELLPDTLATVTFEK